MNPFRATTLCLLALLAACGGERIAGGALDGADIPEEQRYGGTAIVATIGDIPNIGPLTSTDHTANQIQLFVLFTPLIRYNERLEAEPWGARSWEINEDSTMLTFHLRDDIFWHDGVRTTAYDWKFSYDRARNVQTAFPNSAFWTHYRDAEAVDSFTFRVGMRAHAEYLDPWRAFAPSPRHILQDVPPAELRNHASSTTQPLGNGPFRFVSRAPAQNWIFEANPDFPAELGGRPYLDRIVYRVIPEPTTLLTELLTGGIDYYIAPPPDQAQRIIDAPNARLLTFQDRAFVIIGWNQRRPPFDDVRVRRALTMGINREAILNGVIYGYGSVANSTVPPFYWQHNPQAGSDLGYDPEGALALLAEAGWTRGADGMLRGPQGQPFRFELKTNQGNRVRADILQIVQSDLRRIGIDVQPRITEWGTLLSQINDPVARDFDALIIGWVTEFRIDDENLFHCDKHGGAYAWVSYCNPAVDRLLEQMPLIADRDAALPLWTEYQELIAHDQPYTFVYFTERLEGVSNRLLNVNPDARGDWVDASRWFIHPERRGRGQTVAQ
jgi:peptide/nickel transport system substrate-binding protein